MLLRTRNLPLVREFLTAATAILARSVALGTWAIELLRYHINSGNTLRHDIESKAVPLDYARLIFGTRGTGGVAAVSNINSDTGIEIAQAIVF
ncbi:hypothetical protein [Microcoleus sp. herbarium14]|uniref:hypothetical protein n=1 Tax=Microcoleus sp. herbarium14 TaxID=3055439 RepID=UPI002FD68071